MTGRGTESGDAAPTAGGPTTPPIAQTSGQPGGTGDTRRTILFWGGIAGALLGIVLVVLGIVVGFSSGSSDRSSAEQIRAETRSSKAQEQQAAATRDAISSASSALGDEVKSLTDAGNQLTDSSRAITDAFNKATDASNAGDAAGAVRGYQDQSAAIADLDNKLKASRDQLAKAQQSLGALQAQQSQR